MSNLKQSKIFGENPEVRSEVTECWAGFETVHAFKNRTLSGTFQQVTTNVSSSRRAVQEDRMSLFPVDLTCQVYGIYSQTNNKQTRNRLESSPHSQYSDTQEVIFTHLVRDLDG